MSNESGHHIITPTQGESIEFNGVLLEEVGSFRPSSHRWTELRIYKTDGDNYVYVEEGHSSVQGEKTLISVDVSRQLKPVFGYGVLAKRLYDMVGINYTRKIE